MRISVLLYDGFETLDAFGPVEVFGQCDDWKQTMVSAEGGPVRSVHGVIVETQPLATTRCDVLLVPGGFATRQLVHDDAFMAALRMAEAEARYVLSVCTGSALLARAGILDGRRATSNKRAMDWVRTQGSMVEWIPVARWVVDGKFWTSSGVSAGMDMALAFVAHHRDRAYARRAASRIEYRWQEDPDEDPFADVL